MPQTQAVMVTCTTYGTWLRGDQRGWVEDGQIYPSNPDLEWANRNRMKHTPFIFAAEDLLRIGAMIGESLAERRSLTLLALSVQSWHVHLVDHVGMDLVERVVKTLKDAVRWGLRPNRPIWTEGYDKRFCFDQNATSARVRYVERHNEAFGWSPRPWTFLKPLTDCV